MDESEFVPGIGDLRLVGRGGTASVFRSTDRATGGPIIVKVLHVRLDDGEQAARFTLELDRVARLSGERSIIGVRAHGVNRAGHPWLIADDVPTALTDVLRDQGRLPWAEAVAIGVQVADALDAAHRNGVLHGDLKPGDVRIDGVGVARLSDLGLARFAGVTGVPTASADARLAHSPPERVSGGAVDERSDIYSLASILYEAVSGRPPLGRLADHGAETLSQRIVSTEPTSLIRFGVPPSVDKVVLAALAKDPAARPASAADFADALAAAVRVARATVVTTRPGSLPEASVPTMATAPFAAEDVPFDELATPPDGYPILDEVTVLDATAAAPLLAAAGRRERRRRREKLVAKLLAGVVAVAGIATLVVWLVASSGSNNRAAEPTTTPPSSTTPDTAPISTEVLRPVATIGYSFTASFDAREGSAALSGVASPTGEARLKNALASIGRLDNALSIEDGPEPDEGAAVADGVTLIAAMRKELVAGILRFDGQTFSMSGFYQSDSAIKRLQEVIALLRTPVARPDLNPDPDAASGTTTVTATPAALSIAAEPAVFSVPADGRFHVFPLTLRPSSGATTLCLASRMVTGGSETAISLTHSSCSLAHVITISATTPGTYVITDTFVDGSSGGGTGSGTSGSVTLTVVVG